MAPEVGTARGSDGVGAIVRTPGRPGVGDRCASAPGDLRTRLGEPDRRIGRHAGTVRRSDMSERTRPAPAAVGRMLSIATLLLVAGLAGLTPVSHGSAVTSVLRL